MARGQSPYQGAYTFPVQSTVEQSLARGAQAQAQMYSNLGQTLGNVASTYFEKKAEDQQIEAMASDTRILDMVYKGKSGYLHLTPKERAKDIRALYREMGGRKGIEQLIRMDEAQGLARAADARAQKAEDRNMVMFKGWQADRERTRLQLEAKDSFYRDLLGRHEVTTTEEILPSKEEKAFIEKHGGKPVTEALGMPTVSEQPELEVTHTAKVPFRSSKLPSQEPMGDTGGAGILPLEIPEPLDNPKSRLEIEDFIKNELETGSTSEDVEWLISNEAGIANQFHPDVVRHGLDMLPKLNREAWEVRLREARERDSGVSTPVPGEPGVTQQGSLLPLMGDFGAGTGAVGLTYGQLGEVKVPTEPAKLTREVTTPGETLLSRSSDMTSREFFETWSLEHPDATAVEARAAAEFASTLPRKKPEEGTWRTDPTERVIYMIDPDTGKPIPNTFYSLPHETGPLREQYSEDGTLTWLVDDDGNLRSNVFPTTTRTYTTEDIKLHNAQIVIVREREDAIVKLDNSTDDLEVINRLVSRIDGLTGGTEIVRVGEEKMVSTGVATEAVEKRVNARREIIRVLESLVLGDSAKMSGTLTDKDFDTMRDTRPKLDSQKADWQKWIRKAHTLLSRERKVLVTRLDEDKKHSHYRLGGNKPPVSPNAPPGTTEKPPPASKEEKPPPPEGEPPTPPVTYDTSDDLLGAVITGLGGTLEGVTVADRDEVVAEILAAHEAASEQILHETARKFEEAWLAANPEEEAELEASTRLPWFQKKPKGELPGPWVFQSQESDVEGPREAVISASPSIYAGGLGEHLNVINEFFLGTPKPRLKVREANPSRDKNWIDRLAEMESNLMSSEFEVLPEWLAGGLRVPVLPGGKEFFGPAVEGTLGMTSDLYEWGKSFL